MSDANSVVVLDFETTGLSPDMGDRAIEIGAVRIEHGEVTERFQALMNPGQRVSSFIEGYTGISNAMLASALPSAEVMQQFAEFIGDSNLVAHNASFDKRFLDAELNRLSHHYKGQFACSMLLARRVLQGAPNHKLGTLVDYTNIPVEGTFHRALYDSEMTAKVWVEMLDQVQQSYQLPTVTFDFVQQLTKTPAKSLRNRFLRY